MSANYPWLDKTVEIEHDGQALNVTMRKPEGGSDEDWELKTICVPSSCRTDADSVDIADWLERNAVKACDEIEQIAKRAIVDEGVRDKEAAEIERYEAREEDR
jgi:hypothetical protein